MTPKQPSLPPSGFVTIGDAAASLGVKPWDVVRLIEAERIRSVQLVDVDSLRRYTQQGAA